MLPKWMEEKEDYNPPRGGNSFVLKSMKTIGGAMARIRIQRGHEKGRTLPPLFKLCLSIGGILLLSLSQSLILVMAYAAVILLYLATWPAKDIAGILKTAGVAAILAGIILLPAMILNPTLIGNEVRIIIKVLLSVITVSIFNHTTQWNHITLALRRVHVPALFVFTLDITLKYIVLLGNLIVDLLTALQFRSVGRNNRKYTSVGGVMGVTFLKGMETNRQMYEAMQCRGFTDDYRGLGSPGDRIIEDK